MKILVIGREGQLGSTFFDFSKQKSSLNISFSRIDELDLTCDSSIRSFFANKEFDFIINCAAYTAVDKAESETEKAFLLNAEALTHLGKATATMGARVIHISTDYVFSGHHYKPLKPEDTPMPVSVYGKSKLKGETNLLKANPQSMIIRTAWLYSTYGKNFVKTMLKLGSEHNQINVVSDQVGTPTHAADLAGAILELIKGINEEKYPFTPGIFHYTNEGVCSWYDFATAIFQISKQNCRVNPVGSEAFPSAAPRPWYSVLDKTKIKNTYNLKIPYWRTSLEKCLSNLKP